MSRNRSIEIYLKEGIYEDDQVFAVWESLRGRGRPQDVFRRALREGLRSLASSGQLPMAAFEGLDPTMLGAFPPAHAMMIATSGKSRETRVAQPVEAHYPPQGVSRPSQPPARSLRTSGTRVADKTPPSPSPSTPGDREAMESISIPTALGYPSTGEVTTEPQSTVPEGDVLSPSDGQKPRLKPLMG